MPLCWKPSKFGEDYFCRKCMYAIHSLITCDDKGRICNTVFGWPGSVHDNRVWKNSMLRNKGLCKRDEQFFSEIEYLIGDSTFEGSRVMIPAFKKSSGGFLNRRQELFNTVLAKICTRSEHCI